MQRRTNEAILRELEIQENWLINTIIRRKLTFFGHIKRHEGLTLTVMEGMVPGKRGRGWPRRRYIRMPWCDNAGGSKAGC